MSMPVQRPAERARAVTNPNVVIRDVPGSIMMDADAIEAIPWVDAPMLPGLYSKFLKVDLETGVTVSLVKIIKGARLPVHIHYSTAMLFCLKGRFTYDAGSIGPGGFGFEPYGTVHEPDATTDEETIFFTVSTANALIQLFDDDGSPGPAVQIKDRLFDVQRRCPEALAHLKLPDWYFQE